MIESLFIPIVHAEPPPDFIYQTGTQIAQVSSVVIVGLSLALGWCKSLFSRLTPTLSRQGKFFVLSAVLVTITVLFSVTFSPQEPMSEGSAPILSPPKSTAKKLDPFQQFLLSHVQGVQAEKLAELMGENSSLLLLDIREPEERAEGSIPGSQSMRMADILNGDWQDLPHDQPIYIHCATGSRSVRVAEFLTKQGLSSYFLADRMETWLEKGLPWQGKLAFENGEYRQMMKRLSGREAHQFWKSDILVVDTRPEKRANTNPVSGSIILPILFMSSDEIEQRFDELPTPQPVLLVCDNIDLSCYSAFFAGLKLVAKGFTITGMIDQPRQLLNPT
jgi:rhodanese-related sulfurtransferase